MDTFENNLKLLAQKNPVLAKKIENHTELKSEFALDEALSGDSILLKNGQPLNSKTDPEQEAIDMLKAVKFNHSQSFNYIYGLGLGYLLKRFNKSVEGYIIVFEPDLDVLRLVFEMVEFQEELSNPKVFIFNEIEELDSFYEKKYFANFEISSSVADYYKQYDFDNAQEFINKLGYLHGIYDSNYKVFEDKHLKWVSSLINNIDKVAKYDELKVLQNKFLNKPAVIISAGPSLDKNIELLAQNQDKFVIFCVGTALKSAIKHNIVPDFINFVEYLPVTSVMMQNIEGTKSNMILQPITHSELFDKPVKNKFLFFADNDEAAAWCCKKFGLDKKDYINRGTVSVNALCSAKILGCNPIILIGQDLAYTNSKCYAAGSIYEDFEFKDNKVFAKNTEDIVKKTNLNKETVERRMNTLTEKLYKVKGQNGEMLDSPGDYASFIKYFETIAKDYSKSVKLINSTEGGAQIDGYENMSLKEVIENYAYSSLDKNFDYTPSNYANRQSIIDSEVVKSANIYTKTLKSMFEKGCKIVENIEPDFTKFDSYITYQTQYKELLNIYKDIKLSKSTDLINLILNGNEFFIDYYLSKAEDDTCKHFLFLYLYKLFKIDYNNSIRGLMSKLVELSKEHANGI